MGSERNGSRKHVLLHIVRWLMIGATAANCTYLKPETKKNENSDIRLPYTVRQDYDSTLAEYQTLLRALPAARRDQALFLIGLIKSDARNPGRDIDGALASFQELTVTYPASARYDEARILSSLLERIIRLEQEITASAEKNMALKNSCKEHTDCCSTQKEQTVQLQQKIVQLRSQIERLKMIDLGIEEKKREQQRNQHDERSEND